MFGNNKKTGFDVMASMDTIMRSPEHRSVFAKPTASFVKQASYNDGKDMPLMADDDGEFEKLDDHLDDLKKACITGDLEECKEICKKICALCEDAKDDNDVDFAYDEKDKNDGKDHYKDMMQKAKDGKMDGSMKAMCYSRVVNDLKSVGDMLDVMGFAKGAYGATKALEYVIAQSAEMTALPDDPFEGLGELGPGKAPTRTFKNIDDDLTRPEYEQDPNDPLNQQLGQGAPANVNFETFYKDHPELFGKGKYTMPSPGQTPRRSETTLSNPQEQLRQVLGPHTGPKPSTVRTPDTHQKSELGQSVKAPQDPRITYNYRAGDPMKGDAMNADDDDNDLDLGPIGSVDEVEDDDLDLESVDIDEILGEIGGKSGPDSRSKLDGLGGKSGPDSRSKLDEVLSGLKDEDDEDEDEDDEGEKGPVEVGVRAAANRAVRDILKQAKSKKRRAARY